MIFEQQKSNERLKIFKILEGFIMKQKFLQIDGLSEVEVRKLHQLRKEKHYDSLNAFMLDQVRQILATDINEKNETVFAIYFEEVKEVNKAISEKLERREKMNQEILTRLKKYQELISRWLEFEGYVDEGEFEEDGN